MVTSLVKNVYCAKNSYSEKKPAWYNTHLQKIYFKCTHYQLFNFNSYTYYVEKLNNLAKIFRRN